MSIFYIDPENGNDANDGKGWWKLDFTDGSHEPLPGETITGAVSFATAKIISAVVTGGSWGGGNASGTLYLYGKDGTFLPENLDQGGNMDICTIAGDASVSSWKSITSGATAARIAAGDTIRIKKSPDPVNSGINATFTDNSSNITLASPLTYTLSNCENDVWTGATYVTRSSETLYRMQGSYAEKFAIGASFGTGVVCYKSVEVGGNPVDLSAYQNIFLYIKTNVDIAFGVLRVDLCSNADGTGPVNSITIDKSIKAASSSPYHAILLKNGAALGASIRSVAIYAISDPGAVTITVDHVIACNNFHPGALIGTNDGFWYPITSVDGTAVKLGVQAYSPGLTDACVFNGDGGTVAMYYAPMGFYVGAPTSYSTTINQLNDYGTAGNRLVYSGGWNPVNDTRDGFTWFHGHNSQGRGFYASSLEYVSLEYIGMAWCTTAFYFDFSTNMGLRNTKSAGTNSSIIALVNGGFLDELSGDNMFTGSAVRLGTTDRYYCFHFPYEASGVKYSGTLKLRGIICGGYTAIRFESNGCDIPEIELGCENLGEGIDFWGSRNVIRKYTTWTLQAPLRFYGAASFNEIWEYRAKKTFLYFGNFYDALGFGNRIMKSAFDASLPSFHSITVYMGLSRTLGRMALCWDNLNGVNGRWVACGMKGSIADQITAGYNAAWAHGGSGLCMVFRSHATDANSPLLYEFYLPVTGGVAHQLHFWIRKNLSGDTTTAKLSLVGLGITPIEDVSVSLTGSWVEYTSSSFTPEIDGYVKATLKIFGDEAGDVGVDDIHIAKLS